MRSGGNLKSLDLHVFLAASSISNLINLVDACHRLERVKVVCMPDDNDNFLRRLGYAQLPALDHFRPLYLEWYSYHNHGHLDELNSLVPQFFRHATHLTFTTDSHTFRECLPSFPRLKALTTRSSPNLKEASVQGIFDGLNRQLLAAPVPLGRILMSIPHRLPGHALHQTVARQRIDFEIVQGVDKPCGGWSDGLRKE